MKRGGGVIHKLKYGVLKELIRKYRRKKIRKEIVKDFLLSDDTEKKELAEFINEHKKIQLFNYDFTNKYLEKKKVYIDDINDCKYVEDKEKIYFPKKLSDEEVSDMYQRLCMEQDLHSPHLYVNKNFDVEEGSIVLDCGTAEGNFSLSIIKKAGKIFLFEADEIWEKPLNCTFSGNEAVKLIKKYVSDTDDDLNISLDKFIEINKIDIANEKVFVKMDIEGAELKALKGAEKMIYNARNLKLAICAYHTQRAEEEIRNFFKGIDCRIYKSEGYMMPEYFSQKPEYPYFRAGVLRIEISR